MFLHTCNRNIFTHDRIFYMLRDFFGFINCSFSVSISVSMVVDFFKAKTETKLFSKHFRKIQFYSFLQITLMLLLYKYFRHPYVSYMLYRNIIHKSYFKRFNLPINYLLYNLLTYLPLLLLLEIDFKKLQCMSWISIYFKSIVKKFKSHALFVCNSEKFT